MATAAELLYQGNPNSGLGANAQIPVSDATPFEFTHQVLRDIGAREAQKNILRYKQQIDDRDSLLKAISEGAITAGDVLERDMPVVKKALDDQSAAYKDWMTKGYGNIDGAIAYRKATQAAKDAVVQAQGRKIFFDKENGVISKEGIPKFAEARKANLEKNLSNFWGDWLPFQETNRLDLAPIEALSAPIQEDYKDPTKPFEKGKRTYFSYEDALQKAQKNALTPAGMQNMEQLYDAFGEMPPVELISKIKGINKDLERYNLERGLKEGDRDYASPITVVQTPDNKLVIQDPLDQFAAKVSMSGKPKYNSITSELDKGALDVAEQKERERHNKAMEALDRSGLSLNWAKFNYAKDDDKFGAATVLNEAKDIIAKGVETTVESGGKNIKVLRIGDPTLLKTFGNVDKEGNVTNVPDAIDYDRNKDQVKLIYYGDSKTASGKNIIEKEVSLDQRTWLKEIAKRSFPNKDIGKVNTLIDDILKDNGNSLYKMSTGWSKNEEKQSENSDVPAYTKDELLKAGWTNEQIKIATKSGKIKVN